MLDGMMRRLIDPVLDRIAGRLVLRGIGADTVTFTGFAFLVSSSRTWRRRSKRDCRAALSGRWPSWGRLCRRGLAGAGRRGRWPFGPSGSRGGPYKWTIVLDFRLLSAPFRGPSRLRDPQGPNAIAPPVILLLTFYVNGAELPRLLCRRRPRGKMDFRRCAG